MDTFIVSGKGCDDEYELQSLKSLLQFNLSCILHRDITVLEWLRESDFSNVRYNRNYDLL